MSDQRREITLSISTFGLAVCMMLAQCSIADDVDRMADASDMQMCIEGVRAGVARNDLPEQCHSLRKDSK